ncbi:MAG: hypothetical protein JWP87_343 [Labilithrix sp.]|nr:hypothetical protein [Labilithrix sp.]
MGIALAIAFASTAACSLLVPVDGLAGDGVPDGSVPDDATIRDGGSELAPSDSSLADAPGVDDASDASDALPTSWTLLANASPVSPTDSVMTSVELGVRFTVSVPGDIVAIRFYRAVSNADGYVVHLWGATGVLLAASVVPSDVGKPIGWREQAITPAAVVPAGVYVASYFTKNGNPAFTAHGLANPLTSGPLTALANGSGGLGNGLFDYAPAPLTTPPASSFDETNYFVDVRFSPTP